MGFGVGIGAFMDGLSNGANMADRIYESRRQKVKDGQADEDRTRGITRQAKADSEHDVDRTRNLGIQSRDDAEHTVDRDRTVANNATLDAFTPLERNQKQAEWKNTNRAAATTDAVQNEALKTAKDNDQFTREGHDQERALRSASATTTADAQQTYNTDIAGSITQPGTVGTDGTASAGFGYKGQNYATQQEAQAAATKDRPFASHYIQNYAPKMAAAALAAGKPEVAQAWNKYITDDSTQQATENIGRAHQAWAMGDKSGALRLLTTAANNPRISGGGMSVEMSEIKDDKGAVTGYHVVSTDKATGKTQEKKFDTADELWAAAYPMVSPEAGFKTGLDAMNTAKAAKASVAEKKLDASLKDQHQEVVNDGLLSAALARGQSAIAKLGLPEPMQKRVAKELASRTQADGGIGAWSKLSPEDRVKEVMRSISAQDAAIATGGRGVMPTAPAAQGGAPTAAPQPGAMPPVLR